MDAHPPQNGGIGYATHGHFCFRPPFVGWEAPVVLGLQYLAAGLSLFGRIQAGRRSQTGG